MFALPESTEDLASQIAELAGHLWAGTARFLFLIAEFDRRDGWGEWGIQSCAHWLAWRCGMSPVAAREHVRVARALDRLPMIAASFARGELSYSKVRAITRVATPELEEILLEWARHGTAAQLERVARGVRSVRAAADPSRLHRRRSLVCYHDDEGFLVIRGRLEPEEGALFLKALERAEEQLDDVSAGTADEEDPHDHEASPRYERSRADALSLLAESFLATGRQHVDDAERSLVMIHVDNDALERGEGRRCHTSDGAVLSDRTVKRLACDASLLRVVDAPDGMPLSVGRRTRVVPKAMRRALVFRDRGCCFPGCTARRRVDAHHIRHWAEGGETALANLALLCRRHHRLLHEAGFSLERSPAGDLTFRRPDGRLIDGRPVPVKPLGAQLIVQNRTARFAIGPTTCATLDGRPPDYSMAVEGILARTPTG